MRYCKGKVKRVRFNDYIVTKTVGVEASGCVNNLPTVVMQLRPTVDRTSNLLIASPKPCRHLLWTVCLFATIFKK